MYVDFIFNILKLDTHPPQLVQRTQHLLELSHLLSGGSCLAIPIQVLGQLWTDSGHDRVRKQMQFLKYTYEKH